MMENKTYVCGDCGCVFEGKNVIVNLKDRLGKDSFKDLLQHPFKRLSKMVGERVCPECGSDNVAEVEEKVEIELPEYMTSGWDSSLLEEYFDLDEQTSEDSVKKPEKPGIRDFIGKAVGYFKEKANVFKDKYNSSDLMKKIASVAKKTGASTVYHALLLYYALTDGNVPASKKLIVMAALGYFIAPVDFIPDFVLMGLLDDGSVLLFAINQILPYITDEVKAKAYAKLNDWFGKTDIVSVRSGLLPDVKNGGAEVSVETLEVEEPAEIVAADAIEDVEIPEEEVVVAEAVVIDKVNSQIHKNMEITAPYKELNAYVAEKFHQPISLAFGSEKEVKVSYTKRVLFKDMSVNIRIGIEEVKADSVLLSYDVAFGVDSLISGALKFITEKFPALSAGIHPEEGHRIRINLSEIEKAKPVVENIVLRAITPTEDAIRIEFGLKA